MKALLVIFFSRVGQRGIEAVQEKFSQLQWVAPFEENDRVFVVSISEHVYDEQRGALEREPGICLVTPIHSFRFSPRESV